MAEAPVDTDPNAKVNKVPISGFSSTNQEQDRIAREIEAIFSELPEEVSRTWVNAKAIMYSLNEDLGYEDEDELEDAMQMSFLEFCEKMGNIEVGEVESTRVGGQFNSAIRLKRQETHNYKRVILTIKVEEKDDLWQVLYLSPYASWKIPEIEFEVVADGNKKVHNPLYNHMATALQNLELFCVGMAQEMKAAISSQMEELQKCLDLDIKPFTVVVDDPSGLSRFENPDRATRVVIEDEAELGTIKEEEKEEKQSIDPDDCNAEDVADFPKIQ